MNNNTTPTIVGDDLSLMEGLDLSRDTVVRSPRPENPQELGEARVPAPFFVPGRAELDGGKTVLHFNFVNVQVGSDRKNGSDTIPMHELPLMIAKCSDAGGFVRILPNWTPGTQRRQGVTKAKVLRELERLRGRQVAGPGSAYIDGKYLVSRGDLTVNLFNEVYGGANGSPMTLFQRIKSFDDGWMAMQAEVSAQMRKLTEDDVLDLLKRVCPRAESDELNGLEAMSEELNLAAAVRGEPAALLDGRMVAHMTDRGIPEEIAASVALAVSRRESGKDFTGLSDAQWATIPGISGGQASKVKAMKGKITGMIQDYLSIPELAP